MTGSPGGFRVTGAGEGSMRPAQIKAGEIFILALPNLGFNSLSFVK